MTEINYEPEPYYYHAPGNFAPTQYFFWDHWEFGLTDAQKKLVYENKATHRGDTGKKKFEVNDPPPLESPDLVWAHKLLEEF